MRQLENICHWLTVMAPAQLIEPKDLPPEVTADGAGGMTATPEGVTVPVSLAPTPGAPGVLPAAMPAGASVGGVGASGTDWENGLQAEALALLASGRTDVWDELSRRFESRLIQSALTNTRGRRIEAAQKLGIGRNTITRKIQELGLE